MASKTDKQDWDSLGIAIQRVDGETPDAYQAFLQFCWLQGSDRTTKEVAKITGFSTHSTSIWSSNHNWAERAAIVDGLRWAHEYKAREATRQKENEKFAKENQSIKEKAMKAANQMLDVAQHLLQSAEIVDDMIETGHVETVDGRMVPTHTVINMKSKVSDIPRLADTAIKISRLVNDLPTEIIASEIPIGSDLKNLTTEELIALRERNQQILREKGAISKVEPAMISEEIQ